MKMWHMINSLLLEHFTFHLVDEIKILEIKVKLRICTGIHKFFIGFHEIKM